MHLKSISIKGFKSFPERTQLSFAPGVSVIVGPNGCGKSNITDAVLWALGEQRPLAVRGQSMQDVIFAGGEGVAARTSAEVEVVIDTEGAPSDSNLEFSEIAITRKLDRNGDGEYRLNGARCRLSDVMEALSEANLGREMHSVISQGRVESIVNSKPRDRRLLIEEAAGLGKHRKRRRRAQLKLARTRDNLDRALDIEREARSRIAPLRRQAQAAEIHEKIQRQGMELRAQLISSELLGHGSRLAEAETRSAAARDVRTKIEEELGEVSKTRSRIEERLGERDRERSAAWSRLAAVRGAHERLTVRAEALSTLEAELRSTVEHRQETLGALMAEAEERAARGESDPVSAQLAIAGEALTEAVDALEQANATGADGDRSTPVSRVRHGAERAARAAEQAEDLLGRQRQDSLGDHLDRARTLLESISAVAQATVLTRDAAGRRAAEMEARVVGSGEVDDMTEQLRACSRQESELHTRLHTAAEELTAAEIAVSQLSGRRGEAEQELRRLSAGLERELGPAEVALTDEQREEIEIGLERLARRRDRLGPVNPLAEAEYEEAKQRVEELEAHREDLEQALAELEKLIRDTDRKISQTFEETFEATSRNFEELTAHLFPGGRGKLRLVEHEAPVVVADQTPAEGESAAAEAENAADEEDPEELADQRGVEIEVTPAGKAMRRLSLLSGGEKSLVALAFVFAVFLARPSPFYILDEVEAALDDANIDRFLQLVRRFSDRSQFVIVTHQKRTMDSADVLYGVSMGTGGVTKVISRRLPRDRSADQETLSEGVAVERIGPAAIDPTQAA